MSIAAAFLNVGRVMRDASFVLLDPCPSSEKLTSLSQLVRIGFLPSSLRGKSAVVGRRNFRIRYLDTESFRQAYHEIFMRQVYFFRSENESPVIVDCGANIGLATLYFKSLYPNSVIEAFEPDPTTFDILQENVASNRLNGIGLHRRALWDSDGELDFYIGKDSPGQLSMGVLGHRLNEPDAKITVPAVRLSPHLRGRAIDFLKIDIEGSEERVLKDLAEDGALPNIRQMVVEYHHPPEGEPSRLGQLLAMLEKEHFDCEVYADLRPRALRDPLHDVMVYAHRLQVS